MRCWSHAIALSVVLLATRADADPEGDRARAREAFDRGAAAHRRGDHAAAARELSRADAIVPNAVTLETALGSALAADDAVLGMELCARSERGPASPSLAALVVRARSRFAPRVGRARITCPGATTCAASIDGAAVETGRPVFLRVGRQIVVVQRDDRSEPRSIEITPGGMIEIVVPSVSGASVPGVIAAEAPEGISKGWFIAALSAAAVAGGVTIGLGVDAANKHDRFVSAGCPGPVHGDCAALVDAGRAAEVRTNIMLGVTGAIGVAAAVVGVVTLRARVAPRASLIVGGAQIAALRVALP